MRSSLLALFLASLFLAVALGAVAADFKGKVPKESPTAAEIVKGLGKRVGYGPVQTAEFRRYGKQVLAVWYCPFSGEAACYLHAWYFDPEKSKWILFVDRLIRDTHDLSVEWPSKGEALIVKDFQGKEVHRESAEKIPAQDWEK